MDSNAETEVEESADEAATAETAESTQNVLIVDADAKDRGLYRGTVESLGAGLEVTEAASFDDAAAAALELESLDLFIIGVDPEASDFAFDLRDALRERFGKSLAGAFCGAPGLADHLDRVETELVYYKPVDDSVMARWIAEQFDLPWESTESEAEEAAAEEAAAAEAEAMSKAQDVAAGDTDTAPAEETNPDLLEEGTELGDYRISRVLRSDDVTAMYVAEQRSISRSVGLKALHHRHRTDPEKVGAFVDEARSRALVNHSDIALVYEADQQNGITYYAIELMSGPNLAQLAEDGAQVDEDTLFDVLGSVADILLYLKESDLGVVPIQPSMIHLPNPESCRIANPVKGSGPYALDEAAQMKLLGAAVLPFLSRNSHLMPLVQRLGIAGRADGILTAEGLDGALDQIEAAAVVEPETPQQVERRADRRYMMIGGIIGGLIVVGGLLFLLFWNPEGKQEKVFDYMVPIPAGSFVYQDDESVELPQFWIDQYEVTIGQYADFLEAIDADPSILGKIEDSRQPDSKRSHVPPDWDRYYPAAQRNGSFGGTPISLDCPVMQVDWWDAHAYAAWRGGRLPSEQEWEKAARSRSGNLYPWGNELETSRFNSGIDQEAKGEKPAGSVDGFQYWSPVDAMEGDESPYGVRGMAGNVSEWTSTEETDPDFPDRRVPIIRGASFTSADNFELKRRVPADSPDSATLSTGFRVVRDTAPPEPAEDAAPAE